MNGKIKALLVAIVVVFGLMVQPLPGQTAVIDFTGTYGTAHVSTGNGYIDITLTDTQANPTSVAMNISGFTFQADSGVGVSTTLVPPSGTPTYFTLGYDKTPDPGPATWGYYGSSSLYVLTWNPGSGGTGPDFTIIGPSPYTNANGSLDGNYPHNPFILETATFRLLIDGITANTDISNGTIMFGTSWGTTTVPEAGTLLLFGTGLVGLVGYRRVRRMQ